MELSRRRPSELWLRAAAQPGAVTAAVVGAACAATALFVALADGWHTVGDRPLEFAVLSLLAFALQVTAVEVYGRGAISFASAGILCIGFAFGPAPAMGIALCLAGVRYVTSRGKFYRAAFDAADFALSAGCSVLAYRALEPLASGEIARVVCSFVAGAVYYFVNSSLLCGAMSLEAQELPGPLWRERFAWAWPYSLAAGPIGYAVVRAYDSIGITGVVAFTLPPLAMTFAIGQYTKHTSAHVAALNDKNEELLRLAETVRRRHRDTIAALSRSMEAKDFYTGGHVERVSDVAVALARELGVEGEELDAIEIGALLHDIGKIGVPESILHKPGPLDDDEWEVMKRHPVVSEFILTGIDLHPFVLQIARSSHERIDGRGYPDGLAGDEIPLPARIVLVADAYDALTSDRPYRRARSHEDAVREIAAHDGTQFCPRVVAALEQVARRSPQLFAVSPPPLLEVVAG